MSIVDIILALKSRLRFIIAGGLCVCVFGYFVGNGMQSYTASMHLQYNNAQSAEGLAPDGSTLDAYEIMNPNVISQALKNLDLAVDLTVEEVRNKFSVTEVIDSATLEIQQASVEKGEAYEVFPTEYKIEYTYDGAFGANFGNRLLYSLVEAYDDWFADKYYLKTNVTDFLQNVDTNALDYLELCDFVERNINAIVTTLDTLYNEDTSFRSVQTGLNFSALSAYYTTLLDVDYQKYYANVREGLLSRDPEKLVKTYQEKIDKAYLPMVNSQNDSDLAFEMVQTFYEQYKQSSLYQQATAAQSTVTGSNSENISIVYDYDLTLMINTYDDIITRFVNSGVEAANLKHDSEFYQQIIDEYSNDMVSAATKAALLDKNAALLGNIQSAVTAYAKLANDTIRDYYGYKTAHDLKYLMTITVTPNVSVLLVALLALVIGLAGFAIACVFVEMFKRSMEERARRLEQEKAQGQEITREQLEAMQPLERAFFEQSKADFHEFYLLYQAIVSPQGTSDMSEVYVRWKSERLGEVKPTEFLPIAERLHLMDALGVWTLRKACDQLNLWRTNGVTDQIISINYSVQQIESAAFVDSLCSVISDTGANAAGLCFEISGGGEIDNVEYVSRKLVMLKALGAHVAVDRFGDTLSSIRVLYDMPLDIVKVSKRYLLTMDENEVDPFLLNVISICKERGIRVGMLGVEDARQDRILRSLGVDLLQGYFYAGLQTASERTQSIREQERKDGAGANG